MSNTNIVQKLPPKLAGYLSNKIGLFKASFPKQGEPKNKHKLKILGSDIIFLVISRSVVVYPDQNLPNVVVSLVFKEIKVRVVHLKTTTKLHMSSDGTLLQS